MRIASTGIFALAIAVAAALVVACSEGQDGAELDTPEVIPKVGEQPQGDTEAPTPPAASADFASDRNTVVEAKSDPSLSQIAESDFGLSPITKPPALEEPPSDASTVTGPTEVSPSISEPVLEEKEASLTAAPAADSPADLGTAVGVELDPGVIVLEGSHAELIPVAALPKHEKPRSDASTVTDPKVALPVSIVSPAVAELPLESDQSHSESALSETSRPSAIAEPEQSDELADGPWLAIAVALMAIATTVSVLVSFYLYRWRKILLANPNTVVPEEWAGSLRRVSHDLEILQKSYESNTGILAHQAGETNHRMVNLTETFMTLQKALDERDQEIARLKRGYDAQVFRKFVGRFLRVDQALDDVLESEGIEKTDLLRIRRLLQDAFAECGVEHFEPPLGADYRDAEGVADNPKTTPPNDPGDAYKIVEILEPGYRMQNHGGCEIIVPAKVRIFEG